MSLAVSVTTNSTVSPSGRRLTLPACTMPPSRKLRPWGASPATTWLGLKKNTRLDWNALSTRAATSPRPATPPAMMASFLCLGFMLVLLGSVHRREPQAPHQSSSAGAQQQYLRHHAT